MTFSLGVNLPWVRCGHDFGPRPPAWAGAGPTDWAALEGDLKRLRELGVTVVRMWVLAGGVNVAVGQRTDTLARRVPFLEPWHPHQRRWRRMRGAVPERWAWRDTPPLPEAFLEDFRTLFEAARAADVRLVPSLLSFEFFFPIRDGASGVPDQGHAALALRPDFYPRLLEPLLDVAEAHRDTLAAFEVMNEPDWVVRDGHRGAEHGAHPPWVRPDRMAQFLVDGARRIAARGLTATIGFADGAAAWMPPSSRVALRRLAASGRYLHQHHHYPRPGATATLPPASESPIRPCWIGEMATSRERVWQDPDADETSPRFLEKRLALARARGYEGALLWSRNATDPQTDWGESVQAQVRRVAAQMQRE
ncbi:MAG: hypothetical protein AB8I08_27980 [Sandaracinaceae bacterium]